LLMRHLKKFYNKEEVPWVALICNSYYHQRVPHATELCGSFWWRDVAKHMDSFVVVSKIQIGPGDSVLLWHDFWMDHMNRSLAHKFTRLLSYAKDPLISVQGLLGTSDLTDLFNLPLSDQAYEELLELSFILQNHTFE